MKKFVSVFLVCLLFTGVASAAKIGDVMGHTLVTDIAATINGYDIPSYNVDGYTYIVVEDLSCYGFSVSYDNSSRSLAVTRDYSQLQVSNVYQKPYVSPNRVGGNEHNILFTDIGTYLDGGYVHSYNINGQTIIRFDDLAIYGVVAYDNSRREISLTMSGIEANPYPTDRAKMRAQAIIGEYDHLKYSSFVAVLEYDGYNIEFVINSVGQNGNRIATTRVNGTVNNGVCYFDYEDSWSNKGRGTLEILDNGNLWLSFYEESTVGLWSVSCGEGEYSRTGDLTGDYSIY